MRVEALTVHVLQRHVGEEVPGDVDGAVGGVYVLVDVLSPNPLAGDEGQASPTHHQL